MTAAKAPTLAPTDPAAAPGAAARPMSRKPTGAVSPPLILIEGEEGARKSSTAAELTASKRVGECFWLELGEVTADEYSRITGVSYDVLLHDGSWGSIFARVEETRTFARAEKAAGHKPVVLIVDTMTAEWELLSGWADQRARNGKAVKALLEKDPDAEYNVGRNLWNDAKTRHRQLVTMLMTFPGIVILIARGKEVSATNEKTGQPIMGQKEYRIEAEKTVLGDVRVAIRMRRGERATVTKVRSADPQIRKDYGDRAERLPEDWTLDWFIFDVLHYNAEAAEPEYVPLAPDMTPEAIRDEICNPHTDFTRLGELRDIVIASRYQAVELSDGTETMPLLDMLTAAARERNPNPAPAARPTVVPDLPPDDAAQGVGGAAWDERLILADIAQATSRDAAVADIWPRITAARAAGLITAEKQDELGAVLAAKFRPAGAAA